MDELAKELESHRVTSVFCYSHEAHPGEHYPHHTSFEQKMAHARALRDVIGVRRPILVDALTGDCHRAYGSMPNMCWIFGRGGLVVYKADWTDVTSVHSAAVDLLGIVARRKKDRAVYGSFHVQRLEYRPNNPQGFVDGLKRNGPRAVAEWDAQVERWQAEHRAAQESDG